ncbi:MAG: EAL domain-containing protein, partial [bacterium]
HILKIDKTFIDDLLVDEDIYNLTEDIIKMSKRLGLKVVAEGVETKEQYDILCKYGCEIIQGYLISKPIPEEDVINLLNKPNN